MVLMVAVCEDDVDDVAQDWREGCGCRRGYSTVEDSAASMVKVVVITMMWK